MKLRGKLHDGGIVRGFSNIYAVASKPSNFRFLLLRKSKKEIHHRKHGKVSDKDFLCPSWHVTYVMFFHVQRHLQPANPTSEYSPYRILPIQGTDTIISHLYGSGGKSSTQKCQTVGDTLDPWSFQSAPHLVPWHSYHSRGGRERSSRCPSKNSVGFFTTNSS